MVVARWRKYGPPAVAALTLRAYRAVAMPGAHALLHLETERLVLRPHAHDDLDALAEMLGDAQALALWGEPLDRAGALEWIERNIARYAADGFGRCAIVECASGVLIGDCGLARTSVEGTEEVELGWIVRRAWWGMGIAPEAAAAWRDRAFSQLGLTRFVSMVSEENLASRRVAEKLGMRVERVAEWHDEPMLMYALTAPSPRA